MFLFLSAAGPATWKRLSGLHPWLLYSVEMALLLAAVAVLRVFAVRRLRAWAERHDTRHHNQMATVAVRALTPLLVIALIATALNLLSLPSKFLAISDRLLYIATIVVFIYFAAKTLQVLLNRWFRATQSPASQRESIEFFTRIAFGVVATLFVLDNLDVQLKAIWTTLGVGGVAVALALQDTLTNFFAGVYLRLDNSVEQGDYVRIEGSQEGFVGELGWRSTRMRTLDNQLVVVPNAKLATTPFINYSVTSSERAAVLAFKISRDTNPETVKAILLDEATRAAKQITEISLDPPPVVRHVPKLGEARQDYTLTVQVRSSRDRFNVYFALRQRILERLVRERVEVDGAPEIDAQAARTTPAQEDAKLAAPPPNRSDLRKPATPIAAGSARTVAAASNVGPSETELPQRVIPMPEKKKAASAVTSGDRSSEPDAGGESYDGDQNGPQNVEK